MASTTEPIARSTAQSAVLAQAGFQLVGLAAFVWVGALATGAIIHQCLKYCEQSPSSWRLKSIPVFLALLSLGSAIVELVGLVQSITLVTSGEDSYRLYFPVSEVVSSAVALVSGLIAQCYYGRIVYRTARSSLKWKKAAIPWAAGFTVLLLGVATSGLASVALFATVRHDIWIFQLAPAARLSGTSSAFHIAWLSSVAFTDLLLASVLVARFAKDIHSDGFAQTNSVLVALCVCTLETFSLTAVVAIVGLILAVLAFQSPYEVGVKFGICAYGADLIISRAHTASLIFSLSRHDEIRSEGASGHSYAATSRVPLQRAYSVGGQADTTSSAMHGASEKFDLTRGIKVVKERVQDVELGKPGDSELQGHRARLYGLKRAVGP